MITENIILKLTSGEEIVCKLTGNEDSGTYEIENPLLVSSMPKMTQYGIEESVSLRRWIHFSEKTVFRLNKSSILVKADASLGLSKFYEVCVLKMLLESTDDEIWTEPTNEELSELEMDEAIEELDTVLSKTLH